MQILQYTLFRDLRWLFDLELLLHLEASIRFSDCQHRAFHQRVQHAVLDGLGARISGAGVEEENRARLGAIVGVGVAEESEAWLGSGDSFCELSNGAGIG